MVREITTVSVAVTTHCNMKCPDCCCGIPMREPSKREFYDWAYFEKAASVFYGMHRIHLAGGEPTLHPQFSEFAPKFRELFGCEKLTIETNGWGFKRFPETFKVFDVIYASHYTENTFKDSPDHASTVA